MKHMFTMNKIFCTLIISVISASCVPYCEEPSCASGDFKKIRFMSKTDSNGLFFCNTKKYDIKDVIFYSIGQGKIDTVKTYLEWDFNWDFYHTFQRCDSTIGFTLPYFSSSKLYMRLSPTELDSFEFKYQISSNKCCGQYYDIYDFSYNGKILQEDSSRIINIYR